MVSGSITPNLIKLIAGDFECGNSGKSHPESTEIG